MQCRTQFKIHLCWKSSLKFLLFCCRCRPLPIAFLCICSQKFLEHIVRKSIADISIAGVVMLQVKSKLKHSAVFNILLGKKWKWKVKILKWQNEILGKPETKKGDHFFTPTYVPPKIVFAYHFWMSWKTIVKFVSIWDVVCRFSLSKCRKYHWASRNHPLKKSIFASSKMRKLKSSKAHMLSNWQDVKMTRWQDDKMTR